MNGDIWDKNIDNIHFSDMLILKDFKSKVNESLFLDMDFLTKKDTDLLLKAYEKFKADEKTTDETIADASSFRDRYWQDAEFISKYLKGANYEDYRFLVSAPMKTFSGELRIEGDMLISGPYPDAPHYTGYDFALHTNIALTVPDERDFQVYSAKICHIDENGKTYDLDYHYGYRGMSVYDALKGASEGEFKQRLEHGKATEEDLQYLMRNRDMLYAMPYELDECFQSEYLDGQVEDAIEYIEGDMENIDGIEYEVKPESRRMFDDYVQLAIYFGKITQNREGGPVSRYAYIPVNLYCDVSKGEIMTGTELTKTLSPLKLSVDYRKCTGTYEQPHPELDGYWAETMADYEDFSRDIEIETDMEEISWKELTIVDNPFQQIEDYVRENQDYER